MILYTLCLRPVGFILSSIVFLFFSSLILGERKFIDFWAHDTIQEKQAFTDFVDWAFDRWRKDPLMHIYHYGSYEIMWWLCVFLGFASAIIHFPILEKTIYRIQTQ